MTFTNFNITAYASSNKVTSVLPQAGITYALGSNQVSLSNLQETVETEKAEAEAASSTSKSAATTEAINSSDTVTNVTPLASTLSDRILSDDLDFKVESSCTNELGQLCVSFEEMRKNLYESNYELWKSLEERKRLNSAFAHDLRTPITVLKGYADLVKQFSGRLSPEKQAEILQKMSSQISRLEHYTEKMNCI